MNNQFMAKRVFIVLVSIFLIIPAGSAHAITNSQKLISALQMYLDETESNYTKDIAAAGTQFQPLIESSAKKMQDAYSQLKSASKVKIIKIGTNRSYWGQLECPELRPNCIGVDKGPEFQIGELSSFKDSTLKDIDQLNVNQLMIQDGLIELISSSTYLTGAQNFKKAFSEWTLATQQYVLAKSQAEVRRADRLAFENAVDIAIKSAKRAGKSPKVFENAFNVSVIFEINRSQLDKYASTPFSQIKSVKALNNVIQLTRLSAQADQISNSYNLQKAIAFNKVCGSALIGDSDVRATLNFIADIYRQTLNKKITFK